MRTFDVEMTSLWITRNMLNLHVIEITHISQTSIPRSRYRLEKAKIWNPSCIQPLWTASIHVWLGAKVTNSTRNRMTFQSMLHNVVVYCQVSLFLHSFLYLNLRSHSTRPSLSYFGLSSAHPSCSLSFPSPFSRWTSWYWAGWWSSPCPRPGEGPSCWQWAPVPWIKPMSESGTAHKVALLVLFFVVHCPDADKL